MSSPAGTSDTPLPSSLAEIADDFRSASNDLKLALLLEFSDELPALPERYAGHLDHLERVDECQSPLFLTVEVDEGASLEQRELEVVARRTEVVGDLGERARQGSLARAGGPRHRTHLSIGTRTALPHSVHEPS